MKTYSDKLENLKQEALEIIKKLIDEKGTESVNTNDKCLLIEEDEYMINLEGGRYLTEFQKERILDNYGYHYAASDLESEQFMKVVDHLIEEYSKEPEEDLTDIGQDLIDLLSPESYKEGMAESHLLLWFARHRGQSKEELKFDLEHEHGDSLELENTESELDRKLTDKEGEYVSKIFHEAVIDNIEFKNDIVVAWYDTCGDYQTQDINKR